MLDRATHRINHYLVDKDRVKLSNNVINWIEIYPVDSAIHILNNWDLLVRIMPCINNMFQVDFKANKVYLLRLEEKHFLVVCP